MKSNGTRPTIMRAAMLLASNLALMLLASGCPPASGASKTLPGYVAGNSAIQSFETLTPAQCDGVRSLRIFFQHASVGNNVYNGITDLATDDSVKYALPTQQFTYGNQNNLKTWLGINVG